jgi:hypothetical protein
MKMLIPYIIEDFDSILNDRKLNFTGKWKIVYDSYGNETIYVQHQTKISFILLWINEAKIDFLKPEFVDIKETLYFKCKYKCIDGSFCTGQCEKK